MTVLTRIRASDVINQAVPSGMAPITDADITANCPKCLGEVRLSTCLIQQGAETTYICCNCETTLLVIGAYDPSDKPWPGRGYRLNDFVLRNAVDLRIGRLLIPRSPHALETQKSVARLVSTQEHHR